MSDAKGDAGVTRGGTDGPDARAAQPEPAKDNMLDTLADFESTLGAMKKVYAERQAALSRLEQREAELANRERSLAAMREDAETRLRRADEAAATLAEAEREIEARRATIEAQTKELQARELEAVKAQRAELETVREDLERRRTELRTEEARLADQRTEAEALKPKLAAARKEIELAARRLAEVEHRRAEVASEAERVASQRAELESLQVRVEESRDQLDEAVRATQELERRRAELQAESERVAAQRRELDALRTELRDAGERAGALREEVAALESRRAAGSSGAAAADDARVREASEAAERVGRELEGVKAQLAQREASLRAAQERVAALEDGAPARAGESGESGESGISAGDEALLATLGTLRTELEREQAAHAALRETMSQDEGEVDKVVTTLRERLRGEIAARHEAARRADQSDSDNETLRAELELARSLDGAGLPAGASERLRHRRGRLARYKEAVRARSQKVKKAEDGLKRRFDQCEQLLQQRQELARAREQIVGAERKLQRQQANGRVGLLLVCSTITLAILSVLSYAITRQVIPGRYLAATSLKADGRGRELNEQELAEWTRYHLELAADPRFVEAVAQRMGRRGMVDMATPSVAGQRLKADLRADTPRPGEIVLEFVGWGPDRSARELDTIATTLASEANANRNRIDGGATLPPPPAKAGMFPIDNVQLVAAGILLGIEIVVAAFIMIAIWRRLAKAKTRFEQDQVLAATLDEAHWPDPKREAA